MPTTHWNLSKCFGAKDAIKKHLVRYRVDGLGVGEEVADLRKDVDEAFQTLEEKDGYPRMAWADLSDSQLYSHGGYLAVKGSGFLNDQTFDSVTLTGVGAVTITALTPGDTGYTIVLTDAATGNQVVKSGTTFTITLDITGGDTADTLAKLINNSAQDSYEYLRAVEDSAGAMTGAATTGTAMSGGSSTNGLVCYVAGQACTPYHATGTDSASAAYTDTKVKFTVPDLTALTDALETDDAVVVSVISDKVRVAEFSCPLRTLQQAADAPTIQYHDQGDGDVSNGGGDFTLIGTGFLQGQTFDTLTYDDGATFEITITALKPGNTGYSIEVVDGGGAESITKTGSKFTINIDSAADTANDIVDLINANGEDSDGLLRADVVSGGAATVSAMTETDMTGGKGEGLTVMVGDEECLPQNETGHAGTTAKVTDTSLKLTAPNFSNLAADDHAAVYVTSNGVRSAPLTVVIA